MRATTTAFNTSVLCGLSALLCLSSSLSHCPEVTLQGVHSVLFFFFFGGISIFFFFKMTFLTYLHLWHQKERLAANSQDNCVRSQRQLGVGVSVRVRQSRGSFLQAVFGLPDRAVSQPAQL